MTSTVEKEINTYIAQLNRAEKISLLAYIKNIFTSRALEEKEINIEQYNKELEEADAAIERGEYYTNEEVFEITKKLISAGK